MKDIKVTVQMDMKPLPEKEVLISQCFTSLNIIHIKSIIMEAMQEKLVMSSCEPDYMMKQEFLRGQCAGLSYLVSLHENAINSINDFEPQD